MGTLSQQMHEVRIWKGTLEVLFLITVFSIQLSVVVIMHVYNFGSERASFWWARLNVFYGTHLASLCWYQIAVVSNCFTLIKRVWAPSDDHEEWPVCFPRDPVITLERARGMRS